MTQKKSTNSSDAQKAAHESAPAKEASETASAAKTTAAAKKKTAPRKTAAKTPAKKKTAAQKKRPAKQASGGKSGGTGKTAAKKNTPAKKSAKSKAGTGAKAAAGGKSGGGNKKSALSKAKASGSPKSGGGTKKTASSGTSAAKSSGKSGNKSSGKSGNASGGKSTPIVFSLDDVEALVASRKKETGETGAAPEKSAQPKPPPAKKQTKSVEVPDAPTEKRVHQAASLADILGYTPGEKPKETHLGEEDIPEKWKKYYKLLVELREHVREELDLHTTDTLKHSSRDDSGDLGSYGTHQADAGTDTFDRDFALSLVSSEQEALNEIEEAIHRIKDGTYGICEVTGKPIPKARLTAVPFTRFSVEGQAEYEKNQRRKADRNAGGLFGDSGEAPKLGSDDDDDE